MAVPEKKILLKVFNYIIWTSGNACHGTFVDAGQGPYKNPQYYRLIEALSQAIIDVTDDSAPNKRDKQRLELRKSVHLTAVFVKE